MRIAEYKIIGQHDEQRTRIVPAEFDEEGNLLTEAHEETYTVTVPEMGMVYRDATTEELAEYEAEHARLEAEMIAEEPTQSDRIEAQVMYTALMTDTLLEVD